MTVHKRFQQFTVGLLAVLSLLVSSASAACTCSHHQGQAETEITSCHSDSEMSEMTDVDVSDIESPNTNLASKTDCICAEMTQRVFAKPEALKLKKQAALISLETSVSIAVSNRIRPKEVVLSSPHIFPIPSIISPFHVAHRACKTVHSTFIADH